MSDLYGNHIVGFLTRRLNYVLFCLCEGFTVLMLLVGHALGW